MYCFHIFFILAQELQIVYVSNEYVLLNSPDCGVYLKWVHVVYDTLIATLQSLNRNKESDHYQIQLSKWLRDNPKHDTVVTLQQLQEDPPTIDNFKDEFNVWEKKGKAILSVLKKAKNWRPLFCLRSIMWWWQLIITLHLMLQSFLHPLVFLNNYKNEKRFLTSH